MSLTKRKRKREDDSPSLSAKDAFMELRDKGLVETGPKRPNPSTTPAAVKSSRGRGRRKQSLVFKKKRQIMSLTKRKREDDSPSLSAKDAFMELRDKGLVETGPKRPNTSFHFAPSTTPAAVKNSRGRGRRKQSLVFKERRQSSSSERGKKREAIETAPELIPADVSDVPSIQSTPTTLTPAMHPQRPHPTQQDVPPSPHTPIATHVNEKQGRKDSVKEVLTSSNVTPNVGSERGRGSGRKRKISPGAELVSPVIVETPVTDTRLLRSALKDTHSSSSSKLGQHDSISRVSFGPYVTVAEFSPDRSIGDSTDEQDLNSDPQEENSAAPEDHVDLVESPSSSPNRQDEQTLDAALETVSDSNSEEESDAKDEESDVKDEESDAKDEESDAKDEESDVKDEESDVESDVKDEESDVADEEDQMGMIDGIDESIAVASDEEEEVDYGQSPRLRTPHWKEKAEDNEEMEYDEEEPTPAPAPSKRQSSKKKRLASLRKRATRTRKSQPINTLPRSLLKNLFMLYTRRRLTREAMDLVMKFSEAYLKQASSDVHVFAKHAGRKTIEVDDVVLLFQRQKQITPEKSFEFLVNTYLPMEYVEQLLPIPKTKK